MIPKRENSAVRSISREVKLAWLAGILDGEGCLELTIKKAGNGKSYLSPKIRIYNTDIRMVKQASEIYVENNIVFFYTIGNNGRTKSLLTGKPWKTQIGICVTSQGSTLKLLELVHPYLVNKQKMAEIMISVIDFVSGCPKGGNTYSFSYFDTDIFKSLWSDYQEEKKFYLDPSTTTRRAREVLSW